MIVKKAIETRKTEKVLSDEPWELPTDLSEVKKRTQEIVNSANYAPFHYPADKKHIADSELDSIVPWRNSPRHNRV